MEDIQKAVRQCLTAKGYYGTVTKGDEFIVGELEKREAYLPIAREHLARLSGGFAGKSSRIRSCSTGAVQNKMVEVIR